MKRQHRRLRFGALAKRTAAAVLVIALTSTTLVATAADAAVATPTLFKVVTDGNGSATLHWNYTPGAAGYNIYRDGKYKATSFNTTYRNYTDKTSKGPHTYYITAFDESKEVYSHKSNVIKADTSKAGDYRKDGPIGPGPAPIKANPTGTARFTYKNGSALIAVTWSKSGQGAFSNDVRRTEMEARSHNRHWERKANTNGYRGHEVPITSVYGRKITTDVGYQVRVRWVYNDGSMSSWVTISGPRANQCSLNDLAKPATNMRVDWLQERRVKVAWDASHKCGGAKYQVFRNGKYIAETTKTHYNDYKVKDMGSYVYQILTITPVLGVGTYRSTFSKGLRVQTVWFNQQQMNRHKSDIDDLGASVTNASGTYGAHKDAAGNNLFLVGIGLAGVALTPSVQAKWVSALVAAKQFQNFVDNSKKADEAATHAADYANQLLRATNSGLSVPNPNNFSGSKYSRAIAARAAAIRAVSNAAATGKTLSPWQAKNIMEQELRKYPDVTTKKEDGGGDGLKPWNEVVYPPCDTGPNPVPTVIKPRTC